MSTPSLSIAKKKQSKQCPFCLDCGEVVSMDGLSEVAEHLLIAKDISGRWHVHGPLNNESLINEMIKVLNKEKEKYNK